MHVMCPAIIILFHQKDNHNDKIDIWQEVQKEYRKI